MPSKAKMTFDQNCADVDRLLEIHADLAGPAPGRKFGVEVLNKSAVVLICAFWEAFVEDIVAEALDFLVDNTVDATKLPVVLQQFIAKGIKQDKNDLSPWWLAGDGWKVILKKNLSAAKSKHLTNWNTPKSHAIRALFSEVLGFDDLPSHWQRSYLANDKAIKRLDDFIKLRGEIAHRGKAADTVKKVTVLDAFGHVKELVDLTNGATFAYVFKVTGKNPY